MESGIKDFGSTIDNQRESFKITLDVQHFRPEEINVKVADKEVIIEGKHEEKEDDHGFISRQFKRRYVLPSECPSEDIFSTITSDGILTVTVNKKSKDSKNKEIKVPIQMCIMSCPKKEKIEVKSAPAAKVEEEINKKIEDSINNNLDILNNNKSEVMQKEDFSTLKTDLTKELTSMTADKILTEARKETDNLLKMASEIAQMDTMSALDKLDKVMGESETKFADKLSEKCSAKMSETSNFKSSLKETLASEEVSSYKSSMTSMKVSGEQISEIISAELKEAAENI